MKRYFENKNYWALILGGSSGMGLATAKKLAAEGMHLILLYRDPKITEAPFLTAMEELKSSTAVQIKTYNSNALQKETIETVCSEVLSFAGKGSIKTMLHSIARGNLKMLAPGSNQLTADDFANTLHAMGYNIFEWASILLQKNLFAQNATVTALTSEGNQRSWPGYAAVGAAKSALENICRSMAAELAPHGIRTNIIQAGTTETPSFNAIPGHEIIKKEAIKRNPFKRLTTAEDVANAVYLLCTDEASWINGALLHVDGGEHCC